MDAARERRPVKGNIIILWRIADTIVPLLKHLLSDGACAADSKAATNSRSWRPPSSVLVSASRSGPPLRLLLDGAVDASRSVADHEQQGRRAGARMFLEECPVSVSSFEPAIRVEQNLAVVLADAPGGDHRLTGWPARSPSAISSNFRLSGIRTACLVKASYSARTR